jgi:hypothetical protein
VRSSLPGLEKRTCGLSPKLTVASFKHTGRHALILRDLHDLQRICTIFAMDGTPFWSSRKSM